MSLNENAVFELDEDQLDKLTNESPEIRMRALQEVETRVIRCLRVGGTLSIQSTVLLKQLIRWFGSTPLLAAERVLTLLLEIVRSKYGNVVVKKITYKRLSIELEKVMHILYSVDAKGPIDLLKDLQSVLAQKYNVQLFYANTEPLELNKIVALPSNRSRYANNVSFNSSFELFDVDFENGWTRCSSDDVANMQNIVDALNVQCISDSELQVHLTHLQIKLLDYPAEFFLQTPQIFLLLLQIQRQSHSEISLLHVNRALTAYVRQLQQRILIRQNVLSNAAIISIPEKHSIQLRVPVAMGLLLNSCLKIMEPLIFSDSSHNWHLLQLLVETIRTFDIANAPVGQLSTGKLSLIASRLISYCHGLKNSDLSQLVENLVMPRIKSVILNGVLQDAVAMNVNHSKEIDLGMARDLIHPIITDSTYLSCVPDRIPSLNNLKLALCDKATKSVEQKLLKLKHGYTVALSQLQESKRLTGSQLLQVQGQICLVIVQLESETLVKQLFDSIIECIPYYLSNAQLRKEAEGLLLTLLDLPNKHLQDVVFRLMAHPVVEHFHALVNKSNYWNECNNLELARQHILGVPLNFMLLQKLLYYTRVTEAPEHAQQWCIDYLTMLLKLYRLLNTQDFQIFFRLIFPAVPLMVCRSVHQEKLHQVLWDIFDPGHTFMKVPQILRGNLSYMFHPNPQLRKEATARILYTLQYHDSLQIYRPNINNLSQATFIEDLCLIQPPMSYCSIFTKLMVDPFERKCSVETLLRLLQTQHLRPSIRRSTLFQLNILLQNWEAVDEFTKYDMSYQQILDAFQPITADYLADSLGTLLPAMSIFLKLLCHNADFRREMSNKLEIHICLLQILLLLPYETELRRDASVCLFLMLFHEHVTTNQFTIVLGADLSDLLIPVVFELNTTVPSTPANIGLALEEEVIEKYFLGNASLAAQYWRYYIAYQICRTPSVLTLTHVQNLDIRDTLKLKMEDMALLEASQADIQFHRQLFKASNCIDYHSLKQIVAQLQTFLVLFGTAVAKYEIPDLWAIIYKHIALVPGNSVDRQLYGLLLELCLSCIRHGNFDVLNGLTVSLISNPNHSFMILLQDRVTGLDLLHLICECLIKVLKDKRNKNETVQSQDVNYFHRKYFGQLSTLTREHFELRQLQKVRCLLGVLRCFSDQPLNLSVAEAKHYAQHFLQLSSDLRTTVQTGSQLQRDCLYILAQIQATNLPLEKVLRHLLSLCGHSDGEVRSLAWVALSNCISNGNEQDIASVLPRMDFLPGGLFACCLSTMLDLHELMLVRILAGRLFIELIIFNGSDAAIEQLLTHDFLTDALLALKSLKIDSKVTATENLMSQQNSCEVISCYIDICVRIVKFSPHWITVLCNHAFANSMRNVLKLLPSLPNAPSRPYMELCSVHICHLYSLMYKDNFEYLRRTVCRDTIFLGSYLRSFNEVLDFECPERMMVHLLKLFLVICKDDNAYLFLFDQLRKQLHLLLDIFLYGLHVSYCNFAVQRYTLSLISMILIRVQAVSPHRKLVTELENYVFSLDELIPTHDENYEIATAIITNVANHKTCTPSEEEKTEKAVQAPYLHKSETKDNWTNAAVLLYYRLDRLFEYYFSTKTYSFLHKPGMAQVLVCMAIGGLLKLSPLAAYAARRSKLLDRVFNLFEAFFNDNNIGNASGYVRRVGAHKCKDILSNMLVLLNMMTKWHSSIYAVITESAVAVNAVLLLIKIWPWLSHSSLLKQLAVQLAMLLTEHSIEMCKHMSLVLPGQSHSLLELIVRVANYESTRKDTRQANDCTSFNDYLMPALRVMMNGCSCSDGRLALDKLRVLHMFDTILSASCAHYAFKLHHHVLIAWLGFWECYSRYSAGAKPCHLYGLLNAVRRLPPLHPARLLGLRICRNLCFFNGNRPHFVNFAEFIDFLRDVVAQPVDFGRIEDVNSPGSYEEQYLAVLILWKLFGFGAKYKAMLRETKLLKDLKSLQEQLDNLKIKCPNKFQQLKLAENVSDLLVNLFEAL